MDLANFTTRNNTRFVLSTRFLQLFQKAVDVICLESEVLKLRISEFRLLLNLDQMNGRAVACIEPSAAEFKGRSFALRESKDF